MTKLSFVRVLGGLCGLVVFGGWFTYERLRPTPCPGGLFIEFRPPLLAPGPYRFRLELDGGERVCEFEATPGGTARRIDCKMALQVTSRRHGDQQSIVDMAVAAAPDELHLLVEQAGKPVYDSTLTAKYAPYDVRREDDRRFCGDRAFLRPDCVRGSPQCAPYAASCDGPEDCPSSRVCCLSPDWGREYGAHAASECSSERSCLDRFARVGCHSDADCGEDSVCGDKSLASDFTPAVTACRPKAR